MSTVYQDTLFETTRFGAFLRFYRENPNVYWQFRELAIRALSVTNKRIGGRLIWERMRWDYHMQIHGNSRPKMNDHHVPYYVRLLMCREPEKFGDRFQIKSERFDVDPATLVSRCNEIDAQRGQHRPAQGENA